MNNWMQLDDFDFADDWALISHTKKQMPVEAVTVTAVSGSAGLDIHK